MLCPACFTTWEFAEDFILHLEAHGLDPWKCRNLKNEILLTSRTIGKHKPKDPCSCPMWGARFECELRIFMAR